MTSRSSVIGVQLADWWGEECWISQDFTELERINKSDPFQA